MSHKFPEYDNLQLSGVNKKVLDQWQEEDLFARTLALREGAPSFVFYEGPPSANGDAWYSPRHGALDQGYLLPL